MWTCAASFFSTHLTCGTNLSHTLAFTVSTFFRMSQLPRVGGWASVSSSVSSSTPTSAHPPAHVDALAGTQNNAHVRTHLAYFDHTHNSSNIIVIVIVMMCPHSIFEVSYLWMLCAVDHQTR
jgi:hypothetical protein